MLKILGEMIRQVATILILASFVEMLLPPGEINKYLRLVIGLFVVVAILTPVVTLLNTENDWEIGAWSPPAREEQLNSILVQGKELSADSQEIILEQYYRQLERQIEAIAQLHPEVQQVTAEVQVTPARKQGALGEVREVVLKIKMKKEDYETGQTPVMTQPQDPEFQERVMHSVSNFFNLQPGQVRIVSVN